MDKQQLYESIMLDLSKQIKKSINEARKAKYTIFDIKNLTKYYYSYKELQQKNPELYTYIKNKNWLKLLTWLKDDRAEIDTKNVKNGKGRPRSGSKVSNLFIPTPPGTSHLIERYIKAWLNSFVRKNGDVLYADNPVHMAKIMLFIQDSIEKFLLKNRETDDIVDEYIKLCILYNVENLESFKNDLLTNYKKIAKRENGFPIEYIKEKSPLRLPKKRRATREISEELQKIINDYLSIEHEGIDISTATEKELEELAKCRIETDGYIYKVCRPLYTSKDKSDPDAPALLYKVTDKTTIDMANAIRLVYSQECLYTYKKYVSYAYVSPIQLDKYLNL